MKPSLLLRIARGVGWSLLPFLTLGLILHFGVATFQPGDVEIVPLAPEVQPPPATHQISLRLQHADGTPAGDGVVLFFAPEIAAATVDAQGVAIAEMAAEGELRFLAYAPGHAVLEGSRPSTTDATADPVRLSLLPDPDLPPGVKLVFLPRSVTVVDAQQRPLAGILLLARERGRSNAEPWIAFTDTDGIARFPDTTASDLQIEAYAPGLPPRRATRLSDFSMSAEQELLMMEVPVGRLEVKNLPPLALLSWKRLDLHQLLPMVQVSDDGKVLLGPVPPGDYRLELGNRILDLEVMAGMQVVDFSAAAATTG